MPGFLQDVRYALRAHQKSPTFFCIAILTLAIGIGGSTAIFTLVRAVLLQPLGFPDPARLTMIWTSIHSRVPPAYVEEWRRGSRMFEEIAAWRDDRVNLTGRGEPVEVYADRVTPNFFSVLGVSAVIGRTFAVPASFTSVEREVLLSYSSWRARFAGAPNVVGQSLTLDGEVFVIVGVMPERFAIRTLELAESRAEMWIPMALVQGPASLHGTHHVVGRLTSDASVQQAEAELTQIARYIEGRQTTAARDRDWTIEVVPLLEATVRDVRPALLVLLAAVALVLLIACANIGNLLLSRAAARHGELAVRQSLGASRGRIVRQLMTESLVLAAGGGILGVAFAVAGTKILVSALPASLDFPRIQEITVNGGVLLFAVGATAFTAIGFGLLPAWMSAQSALPTGRGSSPGRGYGRVSAVLMISEIALAAILLAGAALLGRSLLNLWRVNPGFDATNVITMRTTLPEAGYVTHGQRRAFSRELFERIRSVPGIRAAGFANYLPLSRFGGGGPFEIDGGERAFSWVSIVGGEYFKAMGIPLLRGRLPDERDTELTQPVVVIDQALAERYWQDKSPVGTRVSWRVDDERLSGEVVGVVGNVRWGGVAYSAQPTMYFWFAQRPERDLAIVARTSQDLTATANDIAGIVRAIDPHQPVADIRPMQELVSADTAQPRFTTVVLIGFAVVALLLAAIGLYGVIAYNVAQRTREVGIRLALGAEGSHVLKLILQRGLTLTAIGLAAGILISLALGRLMAGLLFGVTSASVSTFGLVALVLISIASLATYLPARRAARVDPLVALRYE